MISASDSILNNIFIIKFLAMAVAVSVFSSCTSNVSESPASVTDSAAKMQGVKLTEFDKGEKKWSLSADHGKYSDKNGEIILNSVFIDFFGKDKPYPVQVKATTVSVNSLSGNILFGRGLVGEGADGIRFTAGWAAFSNHSSLLTGNRMVTYKDSMINVSGSRLLLDTSTRKFTVSGGVNTEILNSKKSL